MFTSDNATNIAARYTPNTVEASVHARTQVRIDLFTGAKPRRVLLDGREVTMSYDQTTATIATAVPAGEHSLKIELY